MFSHTFYPNFLFFLHDISAISVTFCNSVTHAESIMLHLDVISLVTREDGEILDRAWIDELWETMLDKHIASLLIHA